MKTFKRIGLSLALVAAFFACAKKESTTATTTTTEYPTVAVPTVAVAVARVERIVVAKSVNADKSPGEPVANFGKKDTVYVSFWTADAPVGTELMARWIDPKGSVLTEDKIVTDTAAGGYSEFHAAKKSGWAAGTYKIEILINGQPAGSTSFSVS